MGLHDQTHKLPSLATDQNVVGNCILKGCFSLEHKLAADCQCSMGKRHIVLSDRKDGYTCGGHIN